MNVDTQERHYLELLASQYPTIKAASTEIIHLSALLSLPKGTEHFLSDIHGEYEAFLHVLKNGSGSIRRKIDETFANSLAETEKRELATLVYYPEQKLPLLLQALDEEDDWYRTVLPRLIKLCRVVASKYPRTAVRAALSPDFANIISELLQEQEEHPNKHTYYQSLIDTIIETGQARAFVTSLAELIQHLSIARLHIIGDVYDRGPGPHIIMDRLANHHAVDVQWGNHDIVWMGAAAGSAACMANVIRVSLRYGNIETLEHGYGISVLPLATFAMETYAGDACELFLPKESPDYLLSDDDNDLRLMAQMHKAITVIQLKLEAEVIKRRPYFEMDDRLLLHRIDFERGVIELDGQEYDLQDTNLPTVDPAAPYALTEREKNVIDKLMLTFENSDRLQQHTRFLLSKGSMYLVYNNNLLYHGCIPMSEDGSFQTFEAAGQQYYGRRYLDWLERLVRQGFFAADRERKLQGLDTMWYLWCGPKSPIFAKEKMATFERYFIADKSTHHEAMNAYYRFRDQESTARKILEEFDLDPETAHIVNGHVPVKVKRGESPIKAGGRLIVIDGGFAKAYQAKTGIAGYTLIFNSYGLLLAAHQSFESAQRAIAEGLDMDSETKIIETKATRRRVRDTDQGRETQARIDDLKRLLEAYRAGLIKEQ